jgi:hypothetical protein
MSCIFVGLERILYLVNRFSIYVEELYLVQPLPSSKALEQLCIALTQFYALILGFLIKSIQIVDKNAPFRIIGAVFSNKDVNRFESECSKLEAQIEAEVQNCERSRTRFGEQQMQSKIEGLEQLLQQLAEPVGFLQLMKSKVSDLWDHMVDDEHMKILTWASSITHIDNHNIAAKGRTSDTGTWLLNHDVYQRWDGSDQSSILWLHGIRMYSQVYVLTLNMLTKASRCWKN